MSPGPELFSAGVLRQIDTVGYSTWFIHRLRAVLPPAVLPTDHQRYYQASPVVLPQMVPTIHLGWCIQGSRTSNGLSRVDAGCVHGLCSYWFMHDQFRFIFGLPHFMDPSLCLQSCTSFNNSGPLAFLIFFRAGFILRGLNFIIPTLINTLPLLMGGPDVLNQANLPDSNDHGPNTYSSCLFIFFASQSAR